MTLFEWLFLAGCVIALIWLTGKVMQGHREVR